jgi:hypothetical protein
LGVAAATKKRDNIVQRADTETMRNTRVTSAILNGALGSSAFEAAIAAALPDLFLERCLFDGLMPRGFRHSLGFAGIEGSAIVAPDRHPEASVHLSDPPSEAIG